ncbi:DUF6090 family protein [Croceitalea vernalis]|uniref:DUF6090 family protein n=1 Tax=Croceitalea vernalis TaxID=3075599 RepID=A0ABU3BIP1_9FLAO|nr:DUF6090 family protein [Croceitalea sp. P007]MDT0622020.1 DUF6090 family protein [Croceitalea sp. P007]
MIKFFRKIRQNLLSEGKTGKYLKYAIGEIILVVIGILIALQINNWNENKKEDKAEIALIEQLINDLEKDAESLETLIPQVIDKADVIKQIYFETQNKTSFNESTNYGDLTWQAFAPLFFEQRHQLSIDQISNHQISKSILDYFNQQKIVELQIEQTNEYVRTTIRPLLGEHGIMNSNYIMSTDSYTEIRNDKSQFIKYDQLRTIYGSQKFESVIFEMRMTYIATTHQAELLLDANKKLVENLIFYIEGSNNED